MPIVRYAILVFAFVFTFISGSRGFFAFDQSIVFDGGYRILMGQVPYKDFIFPHGLLVYLFQAVLFKFVGVNYAAMILGAALCSVAAVLLAIRLVAKLFPQYKILPLAAGLLTSLWFFSPFGTLFPEQVGFLLGLLGLYLVVGLAGSASQHHPNRLSAFLVGVCVTLSFLSKQNTGLLLLPLYFALLMWSYTLRSTAAVKEAMIILIGIFSSAAVFILWLINTGEFHAFLTYSIILPWSMATKRLDALVIPMVVIVVVFSACLVAVTSGAKTNVSTRLSGLIERIKNWQRQGFAALICVYLMTLSFAFDQSMYNNPSLSYVFVGVVFALSVGLIKESALMLALKPETSSVKFQRRAGIIISIFAFILLTGFGAYISLARIPQEAVAKSAFSGFMQDSKLSWLCWGRPTYPSIIDKVDLTEKEFLDLVNYMRETNERFFVFPDFTILYGLSAVVSPQPMLWFHRGLTYSSAYDENLDRRIVEALERNGVMLIVLEKYSFFGTAERLEDFPILRKFIRENFLEIKEFGFFQVLRRVKQYQLPVRPQV